MTSRIGTGIRGLARTSQSGAKESISYYRKSGRDERRLIMVSLFTGISGAVLWYILSAYWDKIGFTSVEIGYMFAAGSASSAITLMGSGFLADKFGRKNLLLVGLVMEAFGILMFTMEKDFVLFIIASIVVNASFSVTNPSLIALLSTKARASNLKFLYGMQSFSNQIGLTTGTLAGFMAPGVLGSVLGIDTVTGYRWIYVVAAILGIIPVILTLRVAEVPLKPERLLLKFDRPMLKILAMFSLQNAFIGFGAALVMPWIAIVFSDGMGATETDLALMFTLSNVVLAVGFFIIPMFERARGAVRLVAVCQLASLGFLVLIPYSSTLLIAALLYAMRSLLMLVPTPILNAYLMNIVNERIRASFYAISSLVWTLAFMASEAVSGYVWNDDYTQTEPFLYCGVFYVVGTLIFYMYFRNIAEPRDAA